MRYDRQRWGWAGVFLGTLVLLTGCAYDATVRPQLSLAEQGEWHLYKKVMTPAQGAPLRGQGVCCRADRLPAGGGPGAAL